MNKTMMVAVAGLACLASGCLSVNKNDGGNTCRAPRVLKDVVHEKYTVGADPVTATDTAQEVCRLFVFGSSATHTADAVNGPAIAFGAVARAKNGAFANACERAKCDTIVGAKYTINFTDYFVYGKATVQITGYPATLTSVELIDPVKTPVVGVCPVK